MKDIFHRIASGGRMLAACAGAYFSRFVGGMDALVYALLTLMALDYLSGVINAFSQKSLSSEIGFRGIAKKALMLLIVGAGSILDAAVLNAGGALRGAVIGFYIANEALSLLENAARLGLPVPEKLKQALLQLKQSQNKEG